ncbi:2-amino-4-hydroxy-6-hydroxymethyldihydropteridine diphosphokinase [Sphingomonas sp. GV3]|uniref:2-amino-4-hydroxy-6- hydroxymethyldihydropteridine diphosphokinase n=1 Tax=Sphingomonas sp. GV3 TaxID=3040671 RepID=UPI00280AD457|nr:2-amino-4-hydroxy-6-hydroxymethyldihydropteridine diphosphokinase [Sphingomonas sp. GV3]
MTKTVYAIGLGSNRRGRHGGPADEVRAALAAIGDVLVVSPVIVTPPLGPSIRRFANAAALIESTDTPPQLLARLKRIEAAFGRRRGRRWGARVIDLDILLWSGGRWCTRHLVVPHDGLVERAFALQPLRQIAPDWRHPLRGRTVRQLAARIDRRRPRA